ncbi:WAS protein family homolog DDB_G0292878-like [Hibiscus syriacus]|uniref:WAS protein family homolog DDB_G0292878-like n=1 Tax=Hibiscus syriacus TaxID=106335 RepID=UPI00192099F3|nr:WAS protein family homolog DDB_G0292878-like [Hibiscus syriacus]
MFVLPSPIPWRSRSGRKEMKEDNFGSFRSQSMRLSRSNSMSASPKLPHSPPQFSPKSSLSPPPPPMTQKPPSLKPVSSSTRNEVSFEKVMVETTSDDDSESEDDGAGETPIVSSERSPNKEEANPSSGNDGGSDVDKKADEFIAKVREQIRLQRIDSIKRSSVQF